MDGMKKVPVREQEPKVRATNFEEVCYGYNEEEAVAEASRCLNCKNARCVQGCPVKIDIPAFVKEVKEGNFEEAYAIITKENALPAICGRVCPQENQCEGKCVRGIKTESVGIGRLERFVADYHREHGKPAELKIEKNGKKFDYKRHQKKIAKSSNERMLKETDFEVEKLSTRLGLLKFEGYITITDNVQNKVYYSVTCISTKRRVAIEVAGSTDNEYLIKQLSEKSSSLNEMYVDFENCIVGHYIRGDGYFPMIVQTYQAESLKIL